MKKKRGRGGGYRRDLTSTFRPGHVGVYFVRGSIRFVAVDGAIPNTVRGVPSKYFSDACVYVAVPWHERFSHGSNSGAFDAKGSRASRRTCLGVMGPTCAGTFPTRTAVLHTERTAVSGKKELNGKC